MSAVVVSIAICTRDRAPSLAATLASLVASTRDTTISGEVLVVDNGSIDDTPRVVANVVSPSLPVRYVSETRPGVARARNAALRTASGQVICFLDDDVRPVGGWLDRLCAPILAGAADAAAGAVRLAPHLERAWMALPHRTWLAATDYLDPDTPQEMVSANMAIGRHVLAKVPAFDPELGPGALGLGEDALFSWQLLRAGFRIAPAFDAVVEHHFDPQRLTRTGFRDAAARRGRTLAYQRHHWEHLDVNHLSYRLWRRRLRSIGDRLARPLPAHEGMRPAEMLLREDVAFLRQYRIERVRPRSYEPHGLVKRTGIRE